MKNLSIAIFLFPVLFPFFIFAANPLEVVINEVAWMGTKANSADEWIELYNNTDQTISLEGWGLYEAGGGTLIEPLTGVIEAKSFYLVERTDDTTVSDIPASQTPSGWGGYGLNNEGEHLQLLDNNSTVIDEINCGAGWFAGEGKPDYKTMERKNPQLSGSDSSSWQTSQNLGGTPKTKNSEQGTINNEQKTENLTGSSSLPAPLETKEYPPSIVINEILPSPEGPDTEEEWIEIFNQNNFEVDLSEWQLTDTVGKTTTYSFPMGRKILPQGFLVISRPITKITLNNDGDGLNLIQPNGKIIDSVIYEKAPRGQSFNKTNSGWVWSSTLTPGSTNIIPTPPQLSEQEPKEEKSETEPSKVEEHGTKRELAAVGEQIPKSSQSLFIFLIALAIALFSGVIIFILKKQMKKVYNKTI